MHNCVGGLSSTGTVFGFF